MSTVTCPVSTVNLSVIIVSAHHSEFSSLIIPFAPNTSSVNLSAVYLSVANLSSFNLSVAITRPLLTYLLLACPPLTLTAPLFTITLSSVRFKFDFIVADINLMPRISD